MNQHRRQGSILVISMVVLFALAAIVLTLSRNAYTDISMSANISGTIQADVIERGAEQYAVAILSEYKDQLFDLTDEDFAQVPVGDGYFWIVKATWGDTTQTNYGFTDESSRLNINTATDDMLRALPGMTDEIAGSIIDWRDTDDEITDNGAESSSYSGLAVSYHAKNAYFESVEEMSLLKGMTRELLYGDPSSTEIGIGGQYYQTYGLYDFFTCWSAAASASTSTTSTSSTSSTQQYNVNDQNNRQQLRQYLRDTLGTTVGDQTADRIGQGNVRDLFDFLERTQLTPDQARLVEGSLTFAQNPQTRGRVNINTAPAEVIVAITADTDNPLSEAEAQNLITNRPIFSSTTPPYMSWVYDVLKEKSVGLGNLICAQGSFYSADIVAANRTGRAFKHVRIVIDSSQTPARIVYRRDLTDRGWPMDSSILTQLRSGQSVINNGGSNSLGGMR